MRKVRFRRLLATVAITSVLGLLFGATALAQTDGTAAVIVDRVGSASAATEPGVLIVSVEAESPAAEAGLVRGDIVLAADGEPVNHAQALRNAVQALVPGATIMLTVQHGDDVRDLVVKIGVRANQAFVGIVPHVVPSARVEAAIRLPAPPSLLDNALKFTPVGGQIEVGIAQQAEHVQLWVADSGLGIASDEVAHIFERFHRGRHAIGAGSGLGLAIVQSIAKAHGGTVEVASQLGIGSRFTIHLPVGAQARREVGGTLPSGRASIPAKCVIITEI